MRQVRVISETCDVQGLMGSVVLHSINATMKVSTFFIIFFNCQKNITDNQKMSTVWKNKNMPGTTQFVVELDGRLFYLSE